MGDPALVKARDAAWERLQKMNPHEKWLRAWAVELRKEGVIGGANTAEHAADEIARLSGKSSGWLIERLSNSQTEYWTGRMTDDYSREGYWSRDANEAVRFSREEDAAVVLAWQFKGGGRVAEHSWINGSAHDGGTVGGG